MARRVFRFSGFPLLALAPALLFLALEGASVRADDVVNVVFTGKVDPPSLKPGDQGTLVLSGKIRKTAHVYKDGFKVTPEERPEVKYSKIETSKPIKYVNPAFPDEPPDDVWMDAVEVRVSFTVEKDAKEPVEVGVKVKWNACDEDQCYAPEEATVVVKSGGATAGSEPGSGATTPPAPATGMNGGGHEGPTPTTPPGGMTATPEPGGGMDVAPAVPPSPDGPFTWEGQAARGSILAEKDSVLVTLTPKGEYHLYAPGAQEGDPIGVEGTGPDSVAWKPPVYPTFDEFEIKAPVTVRVPYERRWGKVELSLLVRWHGCDQGSCANPEPWDVVRAEEGWSAKPHVEKKPTGEPEAAVKVGEHGILFPVVGMAGGTGTESSSEEGNWIKDLWNRVGILFLGPIFVLGILLAFTPCVLPIIPITVSVIGGGAGSLSKGRLTFLLSAYALGLSLSYGILGWVAAATGGSMSAAFQSPIALWAIAGVLLLLSLGMFGIYELQPPQWLQRLQGGAKGGNAIGAFLFGALAAVLASPCTGPAIVAMLVFAAQSGNPALGFSMFFTLGLGMSAVFFAAGSFNLLLRPGPWMVWVRYGFGVMLVALALYFPASAERLAPRGVWIAGLVVAVVVALAVFRHLVKAEGEEARPAGKKSALVAAVLAAATLAVAFLTAPEANDGWIDLRDRQHFVAEVQKARSKGKVTVVDVWAPWCPHCRDYDRVIEGDAALKSAFESMHRVRINVQDDQRPDLRDGIGIKTNLQPYMVFVDERGRLRRDLDVYQWFPKDPAGELKNRLRVLGVLKGQ